MSNAPTRWRPRGILSPRAKNARILKGSGFARADRLTRDTINRVNRLRHWLWNGLSLACLLTLSAIIAAEVFARSANDVWTYQSSLKRTARLTTTDQWRFIFADGGVELSYTALADPNLPLIHYPDDGHFHHEANTPSFLHIEFECRGPYNLSVPVASIGGAFRRIGWGHGRLGFYVSHTNYLGRREYQIAAAVPLWPLAVGAALLLLWTRRMQKRPRRVKPGYCAICGYDLRATPERCPECGAIPKMETISS